MKRFASLCFVVVVGCGRQAATSKPAAPAATSESNTYFKALDQRFDGDSRAYYDTLLELAHDAPDSRAGRKARAVLQADNAAWVLASMGAVASAAIPSFTKYQNRSRQSEAKVLLRELYTEQSAFFAEKNRYCRTLKECRFDATPHTYVVFMTATELAVPIEMVGNDATIGEARSAVDRAAIKPHVEKKKFVAAAVGNLDQDGAIDIWTIDEGGNITHVSDDLE